MKANQILTLLFCLFIFIGIHSCGKASDPVTDTYIPDLSAAPGINGSSNPIVISLSSPTLGNNAESACNLIGKKVGKLL